MRPTKLELYAAREARFYATLRKIAAYLPPEKLRKVAEKEYGLEYLDALEAAYENVIEDAKSAIRGLKPLRHTREGAADA